MTTAYAEVVGYGKCYDGGCRGQQTGSYTAKLSKTGAVTDYLYSTMYYDDRYRMIQQRGNNELAELTFYVRNTVSPDNRYKSNKCALSREKKQSLKPKAIHMTTRTVCSGRVIS